MVLGELRGAPRIDHRVVAGEGREVGGLEDLDAEQGKWPSD
jgi:hypothetical protein